MLNLNWMENTSPGGLGAEDGRDIEVRLGNWPLAPRHRDINNRVINSQIFNMKQRLGDMI